MSKYNFSETEWKSMYNGSALSASRFLSACAAADAKAPRKFYIGDKVIILAGEHVGKTMLICGIDQFSGYIAGGIDGQTVRVNNQDAKIISRLSACFRLGSLLTKAFLRTAHEFPTRLF